MLVTIRIKMGDAPAKVVTSALSGMHDKLSTLFGLILSGVIAANIDFAKLLQGDKAEVTKATGALFVALQGWITNKGKPPLPPAPSAQ